MAKITGKIIVIVKGDLDDLRQLSCEAESWGMVVHTYQDGETAMASISESNVPDVMVCSYTLSGMDGVELAHHLMERDLRPPVLILLAAAGIDTGALPHGLFDFIISKPVEYSVIKGLIHGALAAHRDLLSLGPQDVAKAPSDPMEGLLNLELIQEYASDPETFEMIVEGFGGIIDGHSQQMRSAIAAGDVVEVRKHLHSVIGSTGNLGLQQLYDHYSLVQAKIHESGQLPSAVFIDAAIELLGASLAALKAKGIVRDSFEW